MLRAAPPSGAGVMAGFIGHADTHPPQAVLEAADPSCRQQAPQGRAVGLLPQGGPEVRIRRAGRSIQGAAVRQARELHTLELSEREFVHAYLAVEHDRNRTRKAISKGLAAPQDLKATDSLWRKLQEVMAQRMKGGRK